MNNYLDYLSNGVDQKIQSAPNVGPTPTIFDKKNITERVQEIHNNLSSGGSSNITPRKAEVDLITNSPLNDILDYNEFNDLIQLFKNYINTKYSKSWYSSKIDDLNIYTSLLNSVTDIMNIILPVGGNKDISKINYNDLNKACSEVFFHLILLSIHNNEEMAMYSLLNSYIKLSETSDMERDKGKLFFNIWDTMLLPIAIKQSHLCLIKILEFWFGIDNTFKDLKKYLLVLLSDNY